jgi:hypothetical protein
MRTRKDAAYPQGALGDCDVVCGYVGDLLATHVWTAEEWAAQTARWRLPIFVPNPAVPARQQAKACIKVLRALGVPSGHVYRQRSPRIQPLGGRSVTNDSQCRAEAATAELNAWISSLKSLPRPPPPAS